MDDAVFTGGISPEQFFWCEKCGGHTSARAHLVTKACRNQLANSTLINRLTLGRHPCTTVVIEGAVRRLALSDVGYLLVGMLDGRLSEETTFIP